MVCELVPSFMPWKHGYGSLLSTYLVINTYKSDILDKQVVIRFVSVRRDENAFV